MLRRRSPRGRVEDAVDLGVVELEVGPDPDPAGQGTLRPQEPLPRRRRLDSDEAGDGHPTAGDLDVLACLDPSQELRQLGLRLPDVDLQRFGLPLPGDRLAKLVQARLLTSSPGSSGMRTGGRGHNRAVAALIHRTPTTGQSGGRR